MQCGEVCEEAGRDADAEARVAWSSICLIPSRRPFEARAGPLKRGLSPERTVPGGSGGPPGLTASADGVHPGELRPGLSNHLARFLDASQRGVNLTDGEIQGTVLHFVNGDEPSQLHMGRQEAVQPHVPQKRVDRALEAERPSSGLSGVRGMPPSTPVRSREAPC